MNCPACGSSDVKKNGTTALSNGVRKQRYLCKKCGATKFSTSNGVFIDSASSTHYAPMSTDPHIATVWMSGSRKASATLVIPRPLVKKYAISAGNKVIVTESDEGILIKKLEIQDGHR